MLYRITAPHFVAGIVAETHVTRTAPILKYMMGWRLHEVWKYVVSMDWDINARH
jgi:hypothetical protein